MSLLSTYFVDKRKVAEERGGVKPHARALFVFVAEPAVLPTNHAAERSLRHLVTCRKISGGTRSAAGSATKMTLATLFDS